MRMSSLGALVLALSSQACRDAETPASPDGVACTTQFVYGLAVAIMDGASAQRVCDAEVVAVEGSFSETLRAFGPTQSCTFGGAGERPGVYEVRASKAGYRLARATNVRVVAGVCHVIPVQLTLELTR